MQRHKVIGHRSLRLSQFLLSLNTLPLNVQQIGQRCRPGALPLLSQIDGPRGGRLGCSLLDYVFTFSTVAREGSLRILSVLAVGFDRASHHNGNAPGHLKRLSSGNLLQVSGDNFLNAL